MLRNIEWCILSMIDFIILNMEDLRSDMFNILWIARSFISIALLDIQMGKWSSFLDLLNGTCC